MIKMPPLEPLIFKMFLPLSKISLIIQPLRTGTRAIIDINATFEGIANSEVARELVSYVNADPGHFSHPIKHVLYFNEEQVLCALKVDEPDKPIILRTSEATEIDLLLGSSPKERLSFYDQKNIISIDLKQGEDTNALVLIDDNIPFDHFIQGGNRMRGRPWA